MLQLKETEDPDWEKKVAEWVEKVTEEPLVPKDDLYNALRNGITLCKYFYVFAAIF